MVLAELAGFVPQRLQRGGDRRRLVGHADRGAGLADRGQAGADRQFAGDEVGASGGAARLRVIVGEAHALAREVVQVRRCRIHEALVVGPYIAPANIVAHDDDDIGFLLLRLQWSACAYERSRGCQKGQTVTDYFWFMWVLTNLRLDLYERMGFQKGNVGSFEYVSDFYIHEFWRFVFLQQKVGEYAQTFIAYPPMQRGASFNLEAVKAAIEAKIKAMKGATE